jgi:hypothetical protein
MKKLLFLPILALFLFLSPIAFAGGGPVSLTAFPLRPFADTKSFILQTDIYATQPCSELHPQVTFEDTISGDSITSFVPPEDGTYLTRHYNTGQPHFQWKEICTFYHKATSGEQRQRIAVVSVTVDGTNEKRTTPVSFGNDSISQDLQSYGRMNDYDNTPQVDVITEKSLNQYKREFSLQWQKIPWAARYTVFAKQIQDDGTIIPIGAFETTSDTKTDLILPKESTFYISVHACKEDDSCNEQPENSYDYLIDKSRGQGKTTTGSKKTVLLPSVVAPSTSTSNNNDKVEALHKKVAELEGKLEESNKKQTVLEEKLSQLLNFIRSLFPTFN